MANLVPLNTFKTNTFTVANTITTAYTTPSGVSTVVLLAQFTNIGTVVGNVTMYHSRTNVDVELAKGFIIPPNDAGNVISGRLILEQGDSLKILASDNNLFKFTFSYLETANA